MPLDQFAPGEEGRLSREHVVERVGHDVQRPGEIVRFDLARLEADERVFETRDKPPETAVLRQSWISGSPWTRPSATASQGVEGDVHEGVAREEVRAACVLHRLKSRLVGGERVRKVARRRRGELRSWRLDDDLDHAEAVEKPVERQLPLPPLEVRRQQGVDVGVQPEMQGRVEPAAGGDGKRAGEDKPRMRGAECDDGRDPL